MKRFKLTGKAPPLPDQKKKFFTQKRIIGVAIALIMATSIIGFIYAGYSGPNQVELPYGDHTLARTNRGWDVTVAKTLRHFVYHPADVDDIPYPVDIPEWLRQSNVIYMTSAQNDPLAASIGSVEYALFTNLGGEGRIVVYSFTGNNTYGKPIMTCENATLYAPVILFEKAEDTAIDRTGYCVLVHASTDANMQRAGERMSYTHYGIIPDGINTSTQTPLPLTAPASGG